MTSPTLLHSAHFSTRWKMGTLFILCALADVLFFPHAGSLTYALFALALLGGFLLHNALRLPAREVIFATLFICGQIAAYSWAASPLSVMLLLLGFAFLYLRACGFMSRRAADWMLVSCIFPWVASMLLAQLAGKLQRIRRKQQRGGRIFHLRHWLLPILAVPLFIILLSNANPIFSQWLADAFAQLPFHRLEAGRIAIWLAAAMAAWACIRPRLLASLFPKRLGAPAPAPSPLLHYLFSREAVLRALVLCNLLFLVHGLSDLFYLWGGTALPTGISYAGYAQRGAYTLIVTALLAACFALIALRGDDRAIRILLLVWIGQNILLTVSAMQRLTLYIEVYSLTWLRVAAFIWMGLVAIGLALILLRILWRKSSAWLVGMNLACALSILYGMSFSDTGGFIAAYNVAHSKEMGGGGHSLHVYYLSRHIGVESLPALIHYRKHATLSEKQREHVDNSIAALRRTLEIRQGNWRGWRLRDHWLRLSLDTANDGSQLPPEGLSY